MHFVQGQRVPVLWVPGERVEGESGGEAEEGRGVEKRRASNNGGGVEKKKLTFSLLLFLSIPQMSKKRYIFTIDDDCFVAQTPSGEL